MRTLIGEPLDIPITEERAIPRSVTHNLTNPDSRVGISLPLQLYFKFGRHFNCSRPTDIRIQGQGS